MPERMQTDTLTIQISQDRHVQFNVELALWPEQQARGLMHRTYMDENAGMLFVFTPPKPVSFWMKNTLIELDMLFIGEDGIIQHIHHRAEPLNESPVSFSAPSKAVLEINGGMSEKLEIKPGDRILHPIFTNTLAE